MDIRPYLRDVPDFPKPGIVFKDITPLLSNGPVFKQLMDEVADRYANKGITHIVSVESRGFILGAPLAAKLGVGFVPVRKLGKLPRKAFKETYSLEYGSDSLELHEDAFVYNDAKPTALIVDDVLATGGTLGATLNLVRKAGARIHGVYCLIELSFLAGRAKMGNLQIDSQLVL